MRGSVIDVALAPAVVAAAAELGLEGIEHPRVQRPDLHGADQRPNVLVHVPDIRLLRTALPRAHGDVLVEQLVNGRVRARLALLVDLAQQPRACLLGLTRGLWAGRDHFDQIAAAARHRVLTRIHPYAQGAAGQLVDSAPRTLATGLRSRHNASILASCVTSRVMTCATAILRSA